MIFPLSGSDQLRNIVVAKPRTKPHGMRFGLIRLRSGRTKISFNPMRNASLITSLKGLRSMAAPFFALDALSGSSVKVVLI